MGTFAFEGRVAKAVDHGSTFRHGAVALHNACFPLHLVHGLRRAMFISDVQVPAMVVELHRALRQDTVNVCANGLLGPIHENTGEPLRSLQAVLDRFRVTLTIVQRLAGGKVGETCVLRPRRRQQGRVVLMFDPATRHYTLVE